MNVSAVENSAAMDRGLQSGLRSALPDITDVTVTGHSVDRPATDHHLTHAAFQPHGYSGKPYVISDWASRILNVTRDDWIAHGCYKPKVKKCPALATKQPSRVNYLALVTG